MLSQHSEACPRVSIRPFHTDTLVGELVGKLVLFALTCDMLSPPRNYYASKTLGIPADTDISDTKLYASERQIDALKWLKLNSLFNTGRITMHEQAVIAGIHTEGGWVALARHTAETRKHIIPKSVAVPAALPTMLSVIIFSTDLTSSIGMSFGSKY